MPSSLTKKLTRGKLTPGRGRIVTGDVDQIKYPARHLGVSKDELLRAVDKMGHSTSAVREELGK
jgi:Protein of unknown function (DUF3606)